MGDKIVPRRELMLGPILLLRPKQLQQGTILNPSLWQVHMLSWWPAVPLEKLKLLLLRLGHKLGMNSHSRD